MPIPSPAPVGLTLSAEQLDQLRTANPRVYKAVMKFAGKAADAQALKPNAQHDGMDTTMSPEDQETFRTIVAAFPRNNTTTPIQNGLLGDKWEDALVWRETCPKGVTPPVYRLNSAKDGIVFDLTYIDAKGISHTTSGIPFGAGQDIIGKIADTITDLPPASASERVRTTHWEKNHQIRHTTKAGDVVHMNRTAVNKLVQQGKITLIDLGAPGSPQAQAFRNTYGPHFARLAGIPMTAWSYPGNGDLIVDYVGRYADVWLRRGYLYVVAGGAGVYVGDRLYGRSAFPQDASAA